MNIDVSEISNWLSCRGSKVSTSSTGDETVEAGVGNDTNSEGGTISDIVTGTCGEKYGTYSKTIASVNTKYFLMERL